jgi:hypothetical protein
MTETQQNLSETEEGRATLLGKSYEGQAMDDGREANGSFRLVPVTESIRYRKRAQSAEQKAEELKGQLAEARQASEQMERQLNDMKLEGELMRKLSAAGAVDLEAAVVLAKSRLKEPGDDLDDCVERLAAEKRYLFAERASRSGETTHKTACAKDGRGGSRSILEGAARRAAVTGKRADLQEYLKVRRNFL